MITKIQIVNFKSIKVADVNLKSLNILIGQMELVKVILLTASKCLIRYIIRI